MCRCRSCQICGQTPLTGLEFMVTIPGTIGGGLVMNADVMAQNSEMFEQCPRAGTRWRILRLARKNCKWPIATQLPEGWIFTHASFAVQLADSQTIRARMKEMIAARADSQPVGTHRRFNLCQPDGSSLAGNDAAGVAAGSAARPPFQTHCNFLINRAGRGTRFGAAGRGCPRCGRGKKRYSFALGNCIGRKEAKMPALTDG